MERINSWFDALPRPKLGALGREVPTFRTCGVVGYYVAVIVLMGAGLVTGRSLTVLTIMALVSALSFYAYTYLRRWITGHEELVLLEHVWFAIVCNAGALYLINVPVLAYLDLFCVALCPFLAAGRGGCTLVGCCHGNPSTFGITYNDDCMRDGFSRHLAGVRLFPVPIIEAGGLLLIGVTGFLALPFAAPGKILTWYLLAYAIMRFGLEGIRGDYRPHFLDLSQARWMSIIEVGVAIGLGTGERFSRVLLVNAALLAALVVLLALRRRKDIRRRRLSASHLDELRRLVATEMKDRRRDPVIPLKHVTPLGVSVAVSRAGVSAKAWHVSLTLPKDHSDLRHLCELATAAFPRLVIDSAHCKDAKVLHLLLHELTLADGSKADDRKLSDDLYGHLTRRLQSGDSITRPQPALSPELRSMIAADEPARTTSLSWALNAGRRETGG